MTGVAGGVGATTITAALGGREIPPRLDPAAVVVCRATGDSLVQAGATARLVRGPAGRLPVLAVVLGEGVPGRAIRSRFALLRPNVSDIVLIPFVRRWAQIDSPLDEARSIRGLEVGQLPRPLREFARAIARLNTAQQHRLVAPPASSRSAARTRDARPARRPTPERFR